MKHEIHTQFLGGGLEVLFSLVQAVSMGLDADNTDLFGKPGILRQIFEKMNLLPGLSYADVK